MNTLFRVAISLAGLTSLQASAIDMAAMEKWSNAKVVKYRVEGKHGARTSVVLGDYEGRYELSPPTLNGEYEHFKSVSNSLISDDLVEIKGVRVYPAAERSRERALRQAQGERTFPLPVRPELSLP